MDANLLANEEVTPGTWAFVLADLNQWYVRTSDLTELEVVQIENGQIVKIVPDSLPDVVLSGTVQEISDVFRTETGDILYDVLIRLDDFDPRLRWGMTVEVDFQK